MNTLDFAQSLLDTTTTIFWFRRDLRLEDNAGLYHALKENKSVLCLFIFDTNILDKLEDKADRRVDFIHQSLQLLKHQLEKLGSSLLIHYGTPESFYHNITVKNIYTNHDYEPYARERDDKIIKILNKKKISFHSYKDQVIFEKDEIVKDNHQPYTVFTPFSKKWKATLTKFYLSSYPTEKYFKHFKPLAPLPFPTLTDIGFKKTDAVFPERLIRLNIIKKYKETRDYPFIEGTSRLSVHLRFGTVSIRKLAQVAYKHNETWLNELVWRDFYHMILWHFPHVASEAFKSAYSHIRWRNDEEDFKCWCEGKTGYPIVDAGIRELNATGFMHNRVRMIVASFLTKHLLIDWRWGEAYFASKLLDYDLAANNGGWQWAAGSGCDAAPYFRVFNPALQTQKFDPDHVYIKHWIPEFGTPTYVQPIVDHKVARERVLEAYKVALGK